MSQQQARGKNIELGYNRMMLVFLIIGCQLAIYAWCNVCGSTCYTRGILPFEKSNPNRSNLPFNFVLTEECNIYFHPLYLFKGHKQPAHHQQRAIGKQVVTASEYWQRNTRKTGLKSTRSENTYYDSTTTNKPLIPVQNTEYVVWIRLCLSPVHHWSSRFK